MTRRLKELFLNKKFFHYAWIGIFISALNVFLLWLLIDVFKIPTVIASTGVVSFNFIFRYVLLDYLKIMG